MFPHFQGLILLKRSFIPAKKQNKTKQQHTPAPRFQGIFLVLLCSHLCVFSNTVISPPLQHVEQQGWGEELFQLQYFSNKVHAVQGYHYNEIFLRSLYKDMACIQNPFFTAVHKDPGGVHAFLVCSQTLDTV